MLSTLLYFPMHAWGLNRNSGAIRCSRILWILHPGEFLKFLAEIERSLLGMNLFLLVEVGFFLATVLLGVNPIIPTTKIAATVNDKQPYHFCPS